jgi:hypothetical protein
VQRRNGSHPCLACRALGFQPPIPNSVTAGPQSADFPAIRELREALSCAARGLSDMRYDWPIVSAFVVVGLLIACSVGTGLYAAFGPPGAVEALVSMAAE